MIGRLGWCLIGSGIAVCAFATPSRAAHPENIALNVFGGSIALSPSNPAAIDLLTFGPEIEIGQTFTVTTAGRLLGISIAPMRGSAGPADSLSLSLQNDTTAQPLGTVHLSAAGFPDTAPYPDLGAAGPGYVDLSSLDVMLTPGHVMSLAVNMAPSTGDCNGSTFMCDVGRVGEVCTRDSDCVPQLGLGFGGAYAGGSASINGGFPFPTGDIAFTVVVGLPSPPAGAVALGWMGGLKPYDIHRSNEPDSVRAPETVIATTTELSFGEVPPAGEIWYYAVENRPRASICNYEPLYNEQLIPGRRLGQSFRVEGFSGDLMGIEIAGLRGTSVIGDTLILDLYDADGQLLGSAAIPTSPFPPGGAAKPIDCDENAVGYFDLSALDHLLLPGTEFAFELRTGFGPGVCDPNSHLCTAGLPGSPCFNDEQCDKSLGIGATQASYPGGTMTADGVEVPDYDLAFKVVFRP